MKKSVLSITPSVHKSTIAPEIYGQFSEHLGRCIYDGVYVGEDSDIPNTNGMRNDVVEALREIKLPVLRWPGGCSRPRRGRRRRPMQCWRPERGSLAPRFQRDRS